MPAGVSSAFRTELPAYRSRRKKTRLPWPRHGFLSRQVRSRLISGGFQLRCLLHFVSSHSERRVFIRVGGFFFFLAPSQPDVAFRIAVCVVISKILSAHNFCDITTWDAINLPSCNAGCHIFFFSKRFSLTHDSKKKQKPWWRKGEASLNGWLFTCSIRDLRRRAGEG